MNVPLTDEQKAGLTEEEILAWDEDDGSGGQSDTEFDEDEDEAGDVGDPDDELSLDEGEEEEEGDGDGGGDNADPVPDSGVGADAPVEEESAPKPEPAPRIFGDAEAARLEALKAEKDALADKFDDGEISRADFKAQMTELDTEQVDLVSKSARQSALDEAETQRAADEWARDCKSWFKSAKVKPETLPEDVWKGFDVVLRRLTGSDLGADLDGKAALDEALAIYQRRNPGKWPGTAPKPAVDPDVKAAADKKAGRPSGRQDRETPPTLARVPAADIPDPNEGKYYGLDAIMKLTDPDKIEAAIAKLTPEQRDAYMAS